MTTEKITKKEYFQMLINLCEGVEAPDLPLEDMIDFCNKEIALLDKRAEKAKANAAKKRDEGDALTEQVFECLSDEDFESIATITERIDDETVSVAKVQYRLGQLAKDGRAEKGTIKVPATETTKARTIVGYRKVTD